ncbi:MAG: IS5 family transposase [Anaerolineaceae bacterium]|nr:MAG: IS5 family transposase [Chloroflexota bacterium]GJQ53396.1 MAG: IS5 family transposase [Anaerolineaceae bacterium]
MTKFTQTYPTDLKYSEWLLIEQFFPPNVRGRPRKWEMWLIVNAILYVVRTGCQWRMLPKEFPPWQTVYRYYWRWARSGLWMQINAVLVCQVRQKQGRASKPSGAILDSQSVKTSEGGEARGIDVHKQTPGRKRHIVVDTLGLLLLVVVHSASVQDGTGGKLVLQKLFAQIKHSVYNRWCRMKIIWADGGYEDIVEFVRQHFGWKLEIVRRPKDAKGFQVLPHRWIVERTFGWLGRYRRLARDYEHTVVASETMTYLASIRRMLKLVTNDL